jgi:GNAT superfamily N-acetyltransferase
MRLVIAADGLLEEILDETFPVWHEGLSRQAYGRLNAAQMKTPWGRQHLHRVALVADGGILLSCAKRYRLQATFSGRRVGVCGIGAVFTPRDRRGQGYASALVERLVALERDEGAGAALLFSAIGPSFYERLGFRAVAVDEVTISVTRRDGAPAMLVRAGAESDFAAIAAMHDTRAGAAGFALARDPAFIQFSLARKRLRAGLAPAGTTQVEFYVAEEGASAAAYLILTVSQHGWTVDEAGDRDPSGARLGAILQVLLAREPSVRMPVIRAWWPRTVPVPPQLELTRRHDARDLLMLRALGGMPFSVGADGVFYWRGDVF